MLRARSYFSTWEEPFRLTEVEESELRLSSPSSGE